MHSTKVTIGIEEKNLRNLTYSHTQQCTQKSMNKAHNTFNLVIMLDTYMYTCILFTYFGFKTYIFISLNFDNDMHLTNAYS